MSDQKAASSAKTWNFDGLIIQSTHKRGSVARKKESVKSDSQDAAKPVDAFEAETTTDFVSDICSVEDRLNSLLQKNCHEYPTNEEKTQTKITEKQIDTDEQSFDGAVGLWARDVRRECFEAAPVHVPSFQRSEYQRSVFDPPSSRQYTGILEELAAVFQAPPEEPRRSMIDDLVHAHDEALVYTKADEDCSSCRKLIEAGHGIVLKDCLHTFCRACLVQRINHSTEAVVLCPSSVDQCAGEVRGEEIKTLLNPEAFERYTVQMLYKMRMIDPKDIADEHKNMMTLLNAVEIANDYEYVENEEEFQCGICMENIDTGDGIVLKNCLHQYCKECIGRYIENSEVVNVACPFRDDDGLQCIGFITDSEIRSLVPMQFYAELMKKSLATAENESAIAYHCKTPDCPAWVEIEGAVNQFECPVCKQVNCIACKAVHEGASCEDYQEMIHGPDRRARENVATENQVRRMLVAKTAQSCPRCGILIQRTQGCRHMKCTKCRHDFQWNGV